MGCLRRGGDRTHAGLRSGCPDYRHDLGPHHLGHLVGLGRAPDLHADLWLAYASYLIFRRAIEEPTARARFSAVISLFTFPGVIISWKSIEWWRTQHPGPVISIRGGGGMAPGMEAAAYWNLLPLAMFAMILLTIRLRQENMQRAARRIPQSGSRNLGDTMDSRNFTYMFYGFAAAWAVLVIYVITLVSREKKIHQEMSRLKKLIEEGRQKMNRRNLLRMAGSAAVAGFLSQREAAAQEKVAQATRAMPSPKIKDVQRYRHRARGTAARRRQDHHRSGRPLRLRLRHLHPARRPGECRRREVSEALSDRQAGRPHRRHLAGLLQQLLLAQRPGAQQRHQRRRSGALGHQRPAGRTCRSISCWAASAARPPIATATPPAAKSRKSSTARSSYMASGFRHVRVQVGVPGMAGYGAGGGRRERGPGAAQRPRLRAAPLHPPRPEDVRGVPQSSSAKKSNCCTTFTSASPRTRPSSSAKDVEKFKLFFMEDPLSPEDIAYFRQIRQQCATPIAMGELFNSPHEWTPLISERLIDYIRIHVSQAGGLTPCRKIADPGRNLRRQDRLARPGRRLAHRPRGQCHARSGQLQLRHSGILAVQRAHRRKSSTAVPVMKDGYLYAERSPGWGIEVDEKAAANIPFGTGERGERKAERRLGRSPQARRNHHQTINGTWVAACVMLTTYINLND